MSEREKGAILEQAASLPPLLKARAEGFMQGLTAATADAGLAASMQQEPQAEAAERKEAPDHG